MAEPRRQEMQNFEAVRGARVLIVEARFYHDIADALLAGALRVLDRAGVKYDRISVPGCLEIPPAIAIAAGQVSDCEGVVALGCVIRGETMHYEIVAGESARALVDLSVSRALPIGNGIITVENEAQAWARARMDELDKGGGAAEAMLALIALKRRHPVTGQMQSIRG
jgi:6,7-dimethyl-8-ribityllumazine synthase